ncbi:hypothetical protein HRI_003125600 [Hibiscus trionum]|uniref:Uncharacterized protein n=1 Tax=Hibiscus trionum TaxID=183268 RepID=A0A9W7MAS7_HIBTR|nr:hypothetical protein HRI_003125600 [Hibiscus trionum]
MVETTRSDPPVDVERETLSAATTPETQRRTLEDRVKALERMEDRMNALELQTIENKGYLERILDVLSKGADEMQSPPSKGGPSKEPGKIEGKRPVMVTIIDEQGRYSFNPT